jgi:hypothetical protein
MMTDHRAFSGKVGTGFPKENATNQESTRAPTRVPRRLVVMPGLVPGIHVFDIQ